MGSVAQSQRQSTGMESQRPWVRLPAAPPFFPALSPFQRFTGSKVSSLIRPRLTIVFGLDNWSPDHCISSCDFTQDSLLINNPTQLPLETGMLMASFNGCSCMFMAMVPTFICDHLVIIVSTVTDWHQTL